MYEIWLILIRGIDIDEGNQYSINRAVDHNVPAMWVSICSEWGEVYLSVY